MKPQNVVVSAAYEYGPRQVEIFLKTFRQVNDRDRIVLLVTRTSELEPIARDFDAELFLPALPVRLVPICRPAKTTNPIRVLEMVSRSHQAGTRLAALLPNPLIQAFLPFPLCRLFHARDFLRARCFGNVLLSDVRDVFFQADPFAHPPELEVAMEDNAFGACPINDKWFQHSYGQRAFDTMKGRPIFCSGTILGTHARIQEHLRTMCAQVRGLTSWRFGGQDQAVHNHIVHNVLQAGDYTISTTTTGTIATLGTSERTEVSDGYIVDASGNVFPIVHQYDRLPVQTRRGLRCLVDSTCE